MFDLFVKDLHQIMEVMFSLGLIFQYLDKFFAIQETMKTTKKYDFQFDSLRMKLRVEVDGPKKCVDIQSIFLVQKLTL